MCSGRAWAPESLLVFNIVQPLAEALQCIHTCFHANTHAVYGFTNWRISTGATLFTHTQNDTAYLDTEPCFQ